MKKKSFKDWQSKRAYQTGASEAPEKFIWLNPPKFEDYYTKDAIRELIKVASKYKLDPNDLIAVGIAESGLGRKDPTNPMRIHIKPHLKRLRETYQPLADFHSKGIVFHPDFPKFSMDYAGRLLREAFNKYPSDRLKALQAYSGTGRTIYEGTQMDKHYFGKPVSEIDFWKEQPQGRRVDMISNWIRANEELQKMIFEHS